MTSKETISLMWFRQDLRVNDNLALAAATQSSKVVSLYIHDTSVAKELVSGAASKWWLHHALTSLKTKLAGNLLVLQGDPKLILPEICEALNIDNVYWNRMYEPWAISRDTSIKSTLSKQGVSVKSSNGSLLWEPMQILKKDNTPYKVFTPYYKNGCLKASMPRYPQGAPKTSNIIKVTESLFNKAEINNKIIPLLSSGIDNLNLLPTIPWDNTIKRLWKVSEEGAKENLAEFIHNGINDYKDARNIPSEKGTSLLSPYLHFGQISPNQVWYAVLDAFQGDMDAKGVYVYLSELGWREFSYYLLYHFKDIQVKNVNSKFDKFPWLTNNNYLRAWQQGNTGVPIVDAGMRELWQTGYMHNRVRMIVASYLVKNLLIDWRQGERWFWDCLLDADMASNAASWQWVAGSGADAAPYFRVFNPILQGEKFDKQGEYVMQYCPELRNMPLKYIHKPWEAPEDVLKQANVTLGTDYPHPIVSLKETRVRALEAYSSIK